MLLLKVFQGVLEIKGVRDILGFCCGRVEAFRVVRGCFCYASLARARSAPLALALRGETGGARRSVSPAYGVTALQVVLPLFTPLGVGGSSVVALLVMDSPVRRGLHVPSCI